VIKSFKCKETRQIFNGLESKRFPTDIQNRTLDRLEMLKNAKTINDLRTPPSNHLEKLSGDRKGQWSIRVNNQYRICFEWVDNNAENVELTDYH